MAGIYRERHPEHTVFYRVFFYYFELTFEAERPPPASSAGVSYGSRGEWGAFLRAFLVVLCLLEGRVYIELDGLEISGNLCRFLSH